MCDITGPNLFLDAFDLKLPTIECLTGSLPEFNTKYNNDNGSEYTPEVTIQGFEISLDIYNEEGFSISNINGEIMLPPLDKSLLINPDFYDHTPNLICYNYVEFLCEKFGGTIVGIYIKDGLYPIKIVNGKRIPCRLVLIDSEVM